MADTETSELAPGQSVARDNGERMGRTRAGHLVFLRRRVAEPGFVVALDAPRDVEGSDGVLTAVWAHANEAFDRLMRES